MNWSVSALSGQLHDLTQGFFFTMFFELGLARHPKLGAAFRCLRNTLTQTRACVAKASSRNLTAEERTENVNYAQIRSYT